MLCLLGASAAPAQLTHDAGILRMYQGGVEVGREWFLWTPDRFEATAEIPLLQARLVRRTTYDASGMVATYTSELYVLGPDTLAIAYRAYQDGDSIRWHRRRGESELTGAAAGHAASVVPAQSTALFADLVYRAGGRDTTLVAWSPNEGTTTEVGIRQTDAGVAFTLGPMPVAATVRADGRVQVIEVPAQRVRVERADEGVSLPPLPGRERPEPDYTAPPGAPYTAAEVRVPVDDGAFELAGTLTLPTVGTPPYPAVVTITGSGGQDRDESIWPLVEGYRPYAEIAAVLGERGIAVLRVDDRGVGGSGGDTDSATTLDFADDVTAQVAWLRSRPEIDPERIALIGHSEGGMIGPIVASRDSRLAALVVMAGPSQTGMEILRYQVTRPIETAPGLSADERQALRDSALSAVTTGPLMQIPWIQYFRDYDPLPTARTVAQPVLILHGEYDRQVTAEQAEALGAAIRDGGNADVTVRVFPRLNHLFLPSIEDGSPHEYLAIEDASLPSEVLTTIRDWLAARLRP
jgi:alpha-beta hydrolase superfamily lysophospholipase